MPAFIVHHPTFFISRQGSDALKIFLERRQDLNISGKAWRQVVHVLEFLTEGNEGRVLLVSVVESDPHPRWLLLRLETSRAPFQPSRRDLFLLP
jgi:hypothetical protein